MKPYSVQSQASMNPHTPWVVVKNYVTVVAQYARLSWALKKATKLNSESLKAAKHEK